MNSGLPPSMMSVPRPAMLVATVTAPARPACAMIVASRAWFLAFSTSCGTPRRFSILDRTSDFSTLIVPTSTGWPPWWRLGDVLDTRLELGLRGLVDQVRLVGPDHRLLVGIGTTPSL